MLAIEARGLTKSFRRVRAVSGVDLVVSAGEVVGLLGPNGAGKTTTLMMLLGVIEPDAGEVRVLGHPLPRDRVRAMARVSFTAGYLSFPGDLRVRHFLDVFADIYDVPRRGGHDLMEEFGVAHLLERRGTQLSSGQRTLVSLVRALLARPQLLVLDEPTASLDPEAAARVRATLSEAQARDGFAVLITSHNMDEIERLCPRIVFLAAGRVVADGSPDEITSRFGTADLESAFVHVAQELRT